MNTNITTKKLRGVVTESKSGRRAIIADRWEKLCDLIKNRTMRNISFSIKINKMIILMMMMVTERCTEKPRPYNQGILNQIDIDRAGQF